MERLTYVAENGEVLFHPADLPDDEGITITQLAKDGRYKALEEIAERLANREQAEEQGLLLRPPCKVGDTVYLIDRYENNKFKVYEGKWERVSLVQTSKNSSFELCGEISYDIHDCFYNDGRTMQQGMYVGQESTRIGKVVFLTREEAEAKLAEMEGEHGE